jgi:transcriptional regulator with XRE-family HTH domain
MKYDFRKLRDALEEQLRTQKEVAEATGLSEQTVSQVMLGKAPWRKSIRKIAAFLNVEKVVILSKRRK